MECSLASKVDLGRRCQDSAAAETFLNRARAAAALVT